MFKFLFVVLFSFAFVAPCLANPPVGWPSEFSVTVGSDVEHYSWQSDGYWVGDLGGSVAAQSLVVGGDVVDDGWAIFFGYDYIATFGSGSSAGPYPPSIDFGVPGVSPSFLPAPEVAVPEPATLLVVSPLAILFWSRR